MVKPKAIDVQLPEGVDFSSCDKFLKSREEVQAAICEIIKRQRKTQYYAKIKLDPSRSDLEGIYGDIVKSHFNGDVAELGEGIELTPQFIAKNHLVYGDVNYVTYLVTAIYGGILGLKSEEQLTNFSLEMEGKIHGVDVIGLLERIIELGGETLYQALLIDKLYDTKKSRLKNGGTQIRKRMKHNVGGLLVGELTGKRKLVSGSKNYEDQLKKLDRLVKELGFDFDIASISGDMKVVFEEPLVILDPRTVDSNLKRQGYDTKRGKAKLRTSSEYNGAKIEIEDYFDVNATRNSVDGIIAPFPEIEADSGEHFTEIQSSLGLGDLPISRSGATDTFKYFGAEGYIDLGTNRGRDEIDLSREHGLMKMQNGYFERYPNSLF